MQHHWSHFQSLSVNYTMTSSSSIGTRKTQDRSMHLDWQQTDRQIQYCIYHPSARTSLSWIEWCSARLVHQCYSANCRGNYRQPCSAASAAAGHMAALPCSQV